MSIPQCIIVKFPDTLNQSMVNDSNYDFDRAILEIPVKNCIVEMLPTCPALQAKRYPNVLQDASLLTTLHKYILVTNMCLQQSFNMTITI